MNDTNINTMHNPNMPWTTTAEIIGMKKDLRKMKVVYKRTQKLYEILLTEALGKADFKELIKIAPIKAILEFTEEYINDKGIAIKRKRQLIADKKSTRINALLGDFDSHKHVDAREGFKNYGFIKLKSIAKTLNEFLSENTYSINNYNDTVLLSYGFFNLSLKTSNIDEYKEFKKTEKYSINTEYLVNKMLEDSAIKHLKSKQNVSINSNGNYYWLFKFTDKDTKEVTYVEAVLL